MKLHTAYSAAILIVLFHSQQGFCEERSDDGSHGILRQKNYPLLLRIIREGGHRGLTECQRQFKSEIWNCSLEKNDIFKQLPIFVKTTLPYGKTIGLVSLDCDYGLFEDFFKTVRYVGRIREAATRETAFLHAISSAAVTHEITLQCAQNRIPGCRCGKTRKQPQGDHDWEWGGCSDNTKYGEKETRRFIDKLEKGNDARVAFNLHNNAVGRKVVRESLKKECKCHGVTGSCNLKTCWKQLAPFDVVGSALKQKYRTAVPVSFMNNKLNNLDNNNRYRLVTRKDNKLVYLNSSPDYCVRNVTAGSQGMLGRTCRSDVVSTKECRSLCNSCNLRAQIVQHYKQVKCRCKFVWCCTVKCQLCTEKYSLITCTN